MATNSESISAFGRKMQAAALRIRLAASTDLQEMKLPVEGIAEQQVRMYTPIGETGKVMLSTKAIGTVAGGTLTVLVTQPAKGNAGFPIVWALIGGRKAIVAPSFGPWSKGARAMKTPWGWRAAVGEAEGHDYPGEAAPGVVARVMQMAKVQGHEVIRAALKE